MRLSRTVLVVGLSLASLVPFAAHADVVPSTWRFVGTVRDPLGRPLAGATVADHYNRQVTTDSEGRYVRERSAIEGGQYTLRAFRFDTESTTRVVNATIPYGDITVDFVVKYRGAMGLSPRNISVLPGGTTVWMTTKAPREGICGTARDDRTGLVHEMAYDSSADRWNVDVSVPAGLPRSFYPVVVKTFDCATGQIMSSERFDNYVIDVPDDVAPTVTITSPETGFGYIAFLRQRNADGSTTVLGPVTFVAAISDNWSIQSKSMQVINSDGQEVWSCSGYSSCSWTPEVTSGHFTLKVEATDTAGNVGRDSLEFDVGTPR